jgi:hypothetical protein
MLYFSRRTAQKHLPYNKKLFASGGSDESAVGAFGKGAACEKPKRGLARFVFVERPLTFLKTSEDIL